MKKLTLVLAVLAVVSISLISFKKSKAPTKSEKQTMYYWVRYGCQNWGASQPITPPAGNYWMTSDPGIPQGNCPEMQTSGVCAVRFLRSEITCTGDPMVNGIATPNSGVNPWDGNHLIKYCQQ